MKVIGYIRVSTEKQDLERQKQLIRKYCSERGYSLIRLESDKVSGAKGADERSGLDKILKLSKNDADMILVSELSRISRQEDVFGTLSLIHSIISKMDLVLLDEPDKIYKAGENLDIMDFLKLSIKAYGSADERMRIAKRMATGKYSKIAITPNMQTDATVPFGFKSAPNPSYTGGHDVAKTILVFDEKNSAFVRLMYDLVIQGYTARDVGEKMRELGAKPNRKALFSNTTTLKILRNPIYNGRRIWKGQTYYIDKMIPDDVWNLVQEKLESNKLLKGVSTKHYNPLKGIAKCACGSNFTYASNQDGLRYVCADKMNRYGRHYKKSTCKNSAIHFEALNYAVWSSVRAISLNKEYKAKNDKEIANILAINSTLSDRIIDLQKEIADFEKKQSNLIDRIADTDNNNLAKALQTKYESLDKEKDKAKQVIMATKKEIVKNKKKIDDINNIQGQRELDGFDEHQKAEVYKRLLNKVTYYSETPRSGFIVITYKNGLETLYAYTNYNGAILYSLPSTFTYDVEKHKVIVPVINSESFETILAAYTFKEMKDAYNMDEWKIIEFTKKAG